jgi:hypothetical protein
MSYQIFSLTSPQKLFKKIIDKIYSEMEIYLNLDYIYDKEFLQLKEVSDFFSSFANNSDYPLNLFKNECQILEASLKREIKCTVNTFANTFVEPLHLKKEKKQICYMIYNCLFYDLEMYILENKITLIHKKNYNTTFNCRSCKCDNYFNEKEWSALKCDHCQEKVTTIIYLSDKSEEKSFFKKMLAKI